MLLVVGSYEQMLLGYSLVHDSQSDSRIEAKASFTDHSHNGYVKTLASSKNVLASGSTDERIWLVIFTFKGRSDPNHFIFEIYVVKGRIRRKTTLKLNDEFLDRLKID